MKTDKDLLVLRKCLLKFARSLDLRSLLLFDLDRATAVPNISKGEIVEEPRVYARERTV